MVRGYENEPSITLSVRQDEWIVRLAVPKL